MTTIRRNKDGTTTITYEGKAYHVPAGIEVLRDKGQYFIDGMRDLVTDYAKTRVPLAHPFRLGDHMLMAGLYESRSTVYAMIRSPNGPIGWAEFRIRDGYLEEAGAAMATSHQRQGIYSAFIHSLTKRSESPVVLSSDALTASNVLRWMKHGRFDDQRKRYRTNPKRIERDPIILRPSKKAIEQAVRALLTRINTEG